MSNSVDTLEAKARPERKNPIQVSFYPESNLFERPVVRRKGIDLFSALKHIIGSEQLNTFDWGLVVGNCHATMPNALIFISSF